MYLPIISINSIINPIVEIESTTIAEHLLFELLALPHRLLTQSGMHRHHHVVRYPPHEYATVPAGRNEAATVVSEPQSCRQLGVAAHRGHALSRVVVVHRERFIGARRC